MENEKKSVLGSIAGTFKSELKNNVLDKLGPNLGTSIEKALEARAAGKKFSDTFSIEYKSRLAESLKDKIFGQGIIGKSLRAGWETKFGSKQNDEDIPIEDLADPLNEQQGVLLRIETLATNISDNVYNITAAWSKNAKTLEETRKLQEEQHKQEMMSAEEAALESKLSVEPLTKPTPTGKEKEKSGSGTSGFTGMLSGLLKSANKLKSALGGILKSKKFLALAALTIGAGAAASMLSDTGDQQTTDPTTESPSAPTKINPVITELDKQETDRETEKLLKLSKTKEQAVSTQVSKPSLSSTTPQVVGAPLPTNTDPDVQRLGNYFQKPENIADSVKIEELSQQEQNIKEAIKHTQQLSSSASTPAEKARYDYIIKNQLEPSLQVINNQRQEIINKAEQATKSLQNTSAGSDVSAPTPIKATPSALQGVTSSSMPASSSMGSSSSPIGPISATETGPTMMENSPTSGSSIAANSEAVEYSASKTNRPTITNIDNSSQNMESREGRIRKGIPSPVANRGSIDKMSFYGG